MVVHRAHVREAAVAQHALVGRLAEQRDVLGQQVDRGLVEVVLVQVGDEHGVEVAHEQVDGLGQLDERVAAVVGRVRDGRPRARGVEHRVDEQAEAVELDDQGGVPDQAKPHGVDSAPNLHGIRAPLPYRPGTLRRHGGTTHLRGRGRGDDRGRRGGPPARGGLRRGGRRRRAVRGRAVPPRASRPGRARRDAAGDGRARGVPARAARQAGPRPDAHRPRRGDRRARRPRRRGRRLHDQAVLPPRARRAGAGAPAARRAPARTRRRLGPRRRARARPRDAGACTSAASPCT